jgi:BioD-like phosphotransacetylase family protein
MNALHVTSTAEGTGKTAVSIALARIAQERGAAVGYMKPKGTRLRSAVGKTRDEDPALAMELLDLEGDIGQLEPVVYSPTFVQEAIRGREDPSALRERVTSAYETLSADVDLLIIEGGGDVWTGGIVDLTDVDVADLLDTRVLLLTGYGEGRDLDSVLAATRVLGDRLEGVLFNAVADADRDELLEDVAPFLDGRGIATSGVLPREPDLGGVRVTELADTLGASVLAGESDQAFVERFAVGAMGSDSALEHFHRVQHAAVVTGGDRPEIQTAAIEAPGVNCLVLTGGYRPPDAVLGRAEATGLPVVLVQSNTRTTVDRVEEVLTTGRTRTAATVDRMRDLLPDGVDLDRLLQLED